MPIGIRNLATRGCCIVAAPASAQNKYDLGASDTEITEQVRVRFLLLVMAME